MLLRLDLLRRTAVQFPRSKYINHHSDNRPAKVIVVYHPHRARGLAYLQRGEYIQAIADFDKAIRRGNIEAYADRDDARRQIREYELAMDDYNQAIELNAGLACAYLGRGDLNLLIGEDEKALADFDMTVNMDPERKYFQEKRGGAHAHLQEKASLK